VAKETRMHKRTSALFTLSLLLTTFGFAKDKPKSTLPSYVLRARTVVVIVDPNAGVAIEDPQANQVAQKDVETALLKWGRFEPVLSTQSADLIIVLRRGHGRLVDQTIPDHRQNNRPGMIDSTDNAVTIGAQHSQPNQRDASNAGGPPPQETHPQTEIGTPDDSFTVFEGGVENPLDGNPAWRYVAKDGLRPHSVPAVDQFRKALTDAEKAAAKNP
jgi:hypothetical protein